ncbi:hypothetical protein LZ30DRAFT_3976 [Colletotrichum cereale]|nr:hypothetical protein LZ30DRAFT_3976 [Colletotrichum cereale]
MQQDAAGKRAVPSVLRHCLSDRCTQPALVPCGRRGNRPLANIPTVSSSSAFVLTFLTSCVGS